MNWKTTLAKAAPLLGRLLPIPGAGIAGDLIAAAFGVENNADAIGRAIEADPNAALKLREIENNNRTLLEQQLIAAETLRLETVNRTMRAEAASNDPFVRRWRPLFGYIVALTWGIQVTGITAAILYVVISGTESASLLYTGISAVMGDMAVMWAIALSVLGISVKKRSDDKAIASGQTPAPGLVAKLANALKG